MRSRRSSERPPANRCPLHDRYETHLRRCVTEGGQTMARRGKPGVSRQSDAEQERRDQEVLRANKELAAYFKGRRTEREARAALKIIKAFVRDRERRGARNPPPLP